MLKLKEFYISGEKYMGLSGTDKKLISDISLEVGGLRVVRDELTDGYRICIMENPQEYLKSIGFLELGKEGRKDEIRN